MRNLIIYIILFNICSISLLDAQVLIGDNSTSKPHQNSILTIHNSGASSTTSKGFILPSVDRIQDLPLYDAGQTDLFLDDLTYEGMLMFVKSNNEKRAFYYNGKTWVDAFTGGGFLKTRISMDPNTLEANYPQSTCVLIACSEVAVPLSRYRADDLDELKIVNPDTGVIKINKTGLYRIQASFNFRSSGLHVTPPQISIQALKNNMIVGQAIANMNTLLISGNAPMTASATFMVWASEDDVLNFTVGGAIPILTVADVYAVRPNESTYVTIERVL